MDQESAKATSHIDGTLCDIIGELLGRNIYDVTDHILFYLDWPSLKNAGLVSKSWRVAMSTALVRIIRRGNPNWSAEQLNSWRRFHAHLKNDFQVPVQDPHYSLGLTNSVNLMIDHLQNGVWLSPDMTLDYLPFLRSDAENFRVEHLCRMEMSDNFIIAWESSTRLFKCWTRRTLSPISMDQMRNFPSISLDDVEKEFHLFGNYLYYAESSTSTKKGNFAKVDITKVDLDARSQGVDKPEEFKASVYVDLPGDNARMLIHYVNAVDDMILLLFAVYIDVYRIGDSLTVLWKLERGETRTVLKCDTLQGFPLNGEIFFDKDYLVVQVDEDYDEDVYGFQTYSLLPPRDDGGIMELRWIASFDLSGPVEIDYKNGLLAYISVYDEIALVDVSNGILLKTFSAPIDFLSSGSMIRLTRDFVICSEWDDDEGQFFGSTTFHVWDLHSLVYQPHVEVVSPWVCKFKTFANKVKSFEVDDFGISAFIENDTAKGIQILSCLPACSHCKRLTQPALLTKCSRCKSAAYCSEECETADWFPHHEFICARVDPLSFS